MSINSEKPQTAPALKHPVLIFGLPAILLSFHAIALHNNIYQSIYFFDSIMHFAGGAISAVSLTGMFVYAKDRLWIKLDDRLVLKMLVVGLVSLITIAWEVLELALDTFYGTQMQISIADTIKDQVLGVSGAIVIMLSLRFR